MMAAKLSDDLTAFVSEPILLFRATDGRRSSGNITDGPFVYQTKNGRLAMLWSNIDGGSYCVRIAFSSLPSSSTIRFSWSLIVCDCPPAFQIKAPIGMQKTTASIPMYRNCTLSIVFTSL